MNKQLKSIYITFLFLLFFSLSPSFAVEKVYFYHTDAAGTPIAMTDASGNVVWRADYKPFGEEQSITSSAENNKKFVGKEKDEETGLYYFGARYMDAGIGRFTSSDPAGISEKDLLNPQKLNRYNYSLNNPYRYVDPDGRTVWDILDIGFFAHSAYKFANEPSWSNAGDLGLNTIGLLPLVPSLGVIKAVGKGVDKAIDASKTVKTSGKLYHYTGADPSKIAKEGLQPGALGKVFTTPEGGLSPLQAQIDLALPPNRGLPNHLIEIDITTYRNRYYYFEKNGH